MSGKEMGLLEAQQALQAPTTTDRRTVLSRGLAALAALAGVRLIGTSSTSSAAPEEVLRVLATSGKVRLQARRLHLSGNNKRPATGDRLMGAAEIVDPSGAQKIGELYITAIATHAPFGTNEFSAAHVEDHLFVMRGGTIVGMGHVAPSSAGQPATFAIVGGTGRFEGIRGSYVARQNPAGLGGDGRADYDFNILH